MWESLLGAVLSVGLLGGDMSHTYIEARTYQLSRETAHRLGGAPRWTEKREDKKSASNCSQ